VSEAYLTHPDSLAQDLPAAGTRIGRRLTLVLEITLAVTGLAVLGSYALLALAHRADRYQINWVSSTYAALAAHCNEGTLYPALFDGRRYGGTRYMPLPFVLHAGLARLTGEYLASGKLLTYFLVAVLGLQLFRILRGLGCGPGASLALVSLVPLTNAGFLACTTIRGDLLPVVLQLAALMVAHGKRTDGRAVLAGLLCTAAILSKVTAGWAPLAIACLYLSRRRLLSVFLASWLGSLGLTLGALHVATAGRMLENFTALSSAGVGIQGLLVTPVVFLVRVGRGGVTMGFLVPLVVLEVVLAARRRQVTVYHLGLLFCLPVLLAIFADMGADYNHLVDLVVLAVPVLGCLWARLPAPGQALGGLRAGLALALAWTLFVAWTGGMEGGVRGVLAGEAQANRYPAKPLAGLIGDRDSVLSDDPWVDIARGRLPQVLDTYAVARLAEKHPHLTARLERSIRAGEFDWIVLVQPLDRHDPRDWHQWQEKRLGPRLLRAVADRYELRARAEDFYVYAPKPAGGPEVGQTASHHPRTE
jgi:hypothetical protein